MIFKCLGKDGEPRSRAAHHCDGCAAEHLVPGGGLGAAFRGVCEEQGILGRVKRVAADSAGAQLAWGHAIDASRMWTSSKLLFAWEPRDVRVKDELSMPCTLKAW